MTTVFAHAAFTPCLATTDLTPLDEHPSELDGVETRLRAALADDEITPIERARLRRALDAFLGK